MALGKLLKARCQLSTDNVTDYSWDLIKNVYMYIAETPDYMQQSHSMHERIVY